MNIRIILSCLIVLAIFPFTADSATKPKAPAPAYDPYTEVTNWLWPKAPKAPKVVVKGKSGKKVKGVATETPVAAPAPPAQTGLGKPPRLAKPEVVKKQKVKKVRVAPPKKKKVARASGVSKSDCARVRAAYRKYGDAINGGGQGYSPSDVAFARRACRV